ncbi:hypothetical protein T439DRAFT_379802 [Meredithblackwellia eburnea MCA 4105]
MPPDRGRVHDPDTYLDGTKIQLLVCVLMTLCSFLISHVVQPVPDGDNGTKPGYNHPLFIAWVCTSIFVLYLPIYYLRQKFRNRKGAPHEESRLLHNSNEGQESVQTERLSVLEIAKLAAPFSFLWYSTNACIDAALVMTSVSSLTMCFASGALWSLLIGAAFGVEKMSALKLLSALATMCGVAMVVSGDAQSDKGSFAFFAYGTSKTTGNLLALLSAIGYASFLVYFRKVVGVKPVPLMLFFGLVGLICILFFTPILVIANLHANPTPWTWTMGLLILGDASSSFVADFLNVKALLKTSTLVATLATTLTVPLAVAGDLLLGTELGGWRMALGAFIIIFSFIFTSVREALR